MRLSIVLALATLLAGAEAAVKQLQIGMSVRV